MKKYLHISGTSTVIHNVDVKKVYCKKKKCGDSNEDINIYYAQLSVAIIVWYDEVKLLCNKTWRKLHLYWERTFNMKKIVKRIAAMGAAVMMMSSMAIGASAYEAIKYGRAVGGSGSNA